MFKGDLINRNIEYGKTWGAPVSGADQENFCKSISLLDNEQTVAVLLQVQDPDLRKSQNSQPNTNDLLLVLMKANGELKSAININFEPSKSLLLLPHHTMFTLD